jgi:hypothetical protein
MNGTHDMDDMALGEAARLLEQTTRDARRRLDFRSPLLSLVGAATVLIALGAVWLSVRGQHPYKGPTGAGLGVMYGILACWIATVAIANRRATRGLTGSSVRKQWAYGAVCLATLTAVSVLQGILGADGVSAGIVYGVYPLTAQFIVLTTLGATVAASREDWPGFGAAMAIMLVATGSAFAGARGVWLSDAIGCAIVVLGYSAAQAWLRRR